MTLILAASASAPASAQTLGGSSAQWFHVTWDNGRHGAIATIEGYVQNHSRFWITNVRLLIDGLDGGRHRVGQASGWTFGDIAPGDRGYFTAHAIPGATSYEITVSAFDVVSRGGP